MIPLLSCQPKTRAKEYMPVMFAFFSRTQSHKTAVALRYETESRVQFFYYKLS